MKSYSGEIQALSRYYADSELDANELSMHAPSYDHDQIDLIVQVMQQEMETTEQISRWADPKFTPNQMQMLRTGYMQGLTDQEVDVYRNVKLSPDQMRQAIKGYMGGLSQDQVRLYSDPAYTIREQNLLLRAMLIYRLPSEDMKYVADPRLQLSSMQKLILTLRRGGSIEAATASINRKLTEQEKQLCADDPSANARLQEEFRGEFLRAHLGRSSTPSFPSLEL